MPSSYPKNAPALKAGIIDDQTLQSIGRLIRATAEIEDIIKCFICNLVGLGESRAFVLLGRTAITRRLEIAEMLAKIREDNAHDIYKEAFTNEFKEILECRNALAHGVLIGITEDGKFAFRTTMTSQTEGQSVLTIVATYSGEDISAMARYAETMIPSLEKKLKVQEHRSKRLQQPLKPHPKARAQGRAKQKRPARPSQK